MDDEDRTAERPGDPVGAAAVVSGIVLLSPVAIVLGHVALKRAASSPDQSRTLGLAGVILGYLGLAVTVAGLAVYLLVLGPEVDRASADAYAQADVTAIGNAVATGLAETAALPSVEVSDGGYDVGDQDVVGLLEGDRVVQIAGTSRVDWCVQLDYEGGDESTVSYIGAEGFLVGACE